MPTPEQNASDEHKGAGADMCQIRTVCTHKVMESSNEKLSSNCELLSARPLSRSIENIVGSDGGSFELL